MCFLYSAVPNLGIFFHWNLFNVLKFDYVKIEKKNLRKDLIPSNFFLNCILLFIVYNF